MPKNAIIAALCALAVLSLTGCAQGAAEASSPSPSAVKPVVITPAQENSLRGELRAIDPALDTPRALPNAMMLCRTMARGMPELAQREQVERTFFRDGNRAASVPDGAADRIIGVIKSNGLCRA